VFLGHFPRLVAICRQEQKIGMLPGPLIERAAYSRHQFLFVLGAQLLPTLRAGMSLKAVPKETSRCHLPPTHAKYLRHLTLRDTGEKGDTHHSQVHFVRVDPAKATHASVIAAGALDHILRPRFSPA